MMVLRPGAKVPQSHGQPSRRPMRRAGADARVGQDVAVVLPSVGKYSARPLLLRFVEIAAQFADALLIVLIVSRETAAPAAPPCPISPMRKRPSQRGPRSRSLVPRRPPPRASDQNLTAKRDHRALRIGHRAPGIESYGQLRAFNPVGNASAIVLARCCLALSRLILPANAGQRVARCLPITPAA